MKPFAAALAVLALGTGAGWLVARRLLTVVIVDGQSMAPALNSGDRLLVAPLWGPPRRGDVVAVCPPRRLPEGHTYRWVVKRVAAVPGDTIPEPVARTLPALAGRRVPPGQFIVLGDHPHSLDSKAWGLLPTSALAGRAVRKLTPARTTGTRG
jgi:signal peptidase I